MKKSSPLSLLLPLFLLHWLSQGKLALGLGTTDGSEEWGYVEVRPKAHMFWWLYHSPQRVHSPSGPWPTVLWLQGGPGASGVGIGNFQEIGPLDSNLKPRNSTWLQKADLLFVDNPVGTGFSFVEDESLVVKTDEEAANDLTALLKALSNKVQKLQTSPLFLVAESYGGKYAVTLGLSLLKAIQNGELKLRLGGIALGDTWISPEDFVFSWGPLLKDVSRLDDNGLKKSNRLISSFDLIINTINIDYRLMDSLFFKSGLSNKLRSNNSLAEAIKQHIQNGQYKNATNLWILLESVISSYSNFVDFYNFMLDSGGDSSSMTSMGLSDGISMKKYSSYLSSKDSSDGDFNSFMNGVIKKKLRIIPKNVSWGGQSDIVFTGLAGDFMKPRINEVDELLSKGVNVTVYNGQLDLICATKGTEAWLQKLKWDGLKKFTNLDRTPLFCNSGPKDTRGFRKSYKNLHFYWILGAGHFVPVDQPCVSLQMIGEITQSPIRTSYSRKLKGYKYKL
ncbi:serine carboxypeptidase-like protein 51 [Cinnamomum micranthum f. kanehirae]|uniref:Carboxypeptidase n=1 Tax=Cinnamomum micranthum f. kanehirae TaxID=337451 RepID=A0A443PVK5_9MAGN|nr:serine carboxypeptidase-like protein 51 [Cinnamomum micranthum f. kanehirae]